MKDLDYRGLTISPGWGNLFLLAPSRDSKDYIRSDGSTHIGVYKITITNSIIWYLV